MIHPGSLRSHEKCQAFTSISLVIYVGVGDEFSIEECGACNAPVEGSDDDESFVF
jgi:hypothetical protein